VTLLINAYDNGLSTGVVRSHIPGLLGPSDFRKTISVLVSQYGRDGSALAALCEYRIKLDYVSKSSINSFDSFVTHDSGFKSLLGEQTRFFQHYTEMLLGYFFDFGQSHQPLDELDGMAVGNLLIAGAHLKFGTFNKAIHEICSTFGLSTVVNNVSVSDNTYLMALKRSGELLDDEAKLVAPQSLSPIYDLFFLPNGLTDHDRLRLEKMGFEDKLSILNSLNVTPSISTEAKNALTNADLIVLGAGTQYSSLMPSYKIVRDSMTHIDEKKIVMVANLDPDHDIRGCSLEQIVARVNYFLFSDPNKKTSRIVVDSRITLPVGDIEGNILDIADIRSVSDSAKHSGPKLANFILETSRSSAELKLRVIVSLNRSQFSQDFIEEFRELSLPLKDVHFDLVSEEQMNAGYMHMIKTWLLNPDSDALLILFGDGMYSANDVLPALSVLESGPYGLISGSRVQSKSQWTDSINLLSKRSFVKILLRLGGLFTSLIIFIRSGVWRTDFFTGFQLLHANNLRGQSSNWSDSEFDTFSQMQLRIMKSSIPVAEVPVQYRSFESRLRSRSYFHRVSTLFSIR